MAIATFSSASPSSSMIPVSSAGWVSIGRPAMLGSTSAQYSGTFQLAGMLLNEMGIGFASCSPQKSSAGLARLGLPGFRQLDRTVGQAALGELVVWPFG